MCVERGRRIPCTGTGDATRMYVLCVCLLVDRASAFQSERKKKHKLPESDGGTVLSVSVSHQNPSPPWYVLCGMHTSKIGVTFIN
jgi:hypothetical protein